MKKWLPLLLALALLLPGCGKKDTVRAAICLKQCTDSAAVEKMDTMRKALTEAGCTVAVADAEEDQSRQTRQIQELIEEDYDLIVAEPVMMEMAQQIAQIGMDADVPIIFIGYEPEAAVLDSWEKLCYIGAQEDQIGLVQAQFTQVLADGGDLNGDGVVTYGVIAGPEDHLDTQIRTNGCMEALQGNCLEVRYCQDSRESAKAQCAALLSFYGKDMEAVLCNSDVLALGAMDAISEGGRTTGKDIYLVGIGGDIQSRLLIRSGDLTATVHLPAEALAQLVANGAKLLMEDEPVEKRQYTQYVLLTRENVEDYIKE